MFDELSAVNHHDDVSQTFDADFGGAFVNRVLDDGTIIGRSAMLGGHADADQLDDDQRNALAEIEGSRTVDDAETIIRRELADAHAFILSAMPAGTEVRVAREYVCRNWRTATLPTDTSNKLAIMATVFIDDKCVAYGEGDSPMAAAVRALEQYAAAPAVA